MNLAELKSRARSLAREGKSEQALELYRGPIENDPGDLDAGAWTHAGDLQLLLGLNDQAAASFIHASESFAGEGLNNLALALCQRLIRADPDRADSYLRLARLSTTQGYARDAIGGFREYIERMTAAGEAGHATTTLREILAELPADSDVAAKLREFTGETPAGEPDALRPALETEIPADSTDIEADRHLPDIEPEVGSTEAVMDAGTAVTEPIAPLEGLEPTHLSAEVGVSDVDNADLPLLDADMTPREPAFAENVDADLPTEGDRAPEPLPLLTDEARDRPAEEAMADAPGEPAGVLPDEAGRDEEPEEAPPTADRYVDLGALVLDDEPTEVAALDAGATEQSIDEVLDLVRADVPHTIDPKDAASHYDLGLAFKEMGLLDDAISQLQRALRGGANLLATLEVLGECYAGKGDPALAARVLERATRLHDVRESDLVGVRYWLGRCHEAMHEPDEALASYRRVLAADPDFRDASARIDSLGAAGPEEL